MLMLINICLSRAILMQMAGMTSTDFNGANMNPYISVELGAMNAINAARPVKYVRDGRFVVLLTGNFTHIRQGCYTGIKAIIRFDDSHLMTDNLTTIKQSTEKHVDISSMLNDYNCNIYNDLS